MNTEQMRIEFEAWYEDKFNLPIGNWSVENDLWNAWQAALASQAKSVPECGEVKYPLHAYIWKRDSTNEWVLEISGTINDTNFTVRHTEPISTNPEVVPSLSSLVYTTPQQADKVRELEKAMWTLKQIADLDPKSNVGNAIFMARVAIDQAMKGE